MLGGLRHLLRDIAGQRLRAALTMMGLAWGTLAICLLLAFGEGLQAKLLEEQAGLGTNIVIGWPGKTSKPFAGLGRGRRILLAVDDTAFLRHGVPGLEAVSGEVRKSLVLRYGRRTRRVQVSGVEPSFGGLRNLFPRPGGRFLDGEDQRRRRRVAFLGFRLADQLFGPIDPVGKTIFLHGAPFLVVGVLREKTQTSAYGGRDADSVFVPLATLRVLTGERYLSNFVFRAVDPARSKEIRERVRVALARKHRFAPDDEEAISYWDTTEGVRFLATFMAGFRVFLGVLGALTLVAAGIGVSNIMSVVVEERTREIGIRMALGATPRRILGRFLAETLLLAGIGGGAGFAAAAGIIAAFPLLGLAEYVGNPTLSPGVAGITTGLLAAVALVAGWFPAREAALLDPVIAIRGG